MLIEALDQWLEVPSQVLQTIKEIVDQLHNASLILDDIEDNSPLRRMNPAVHTVFDPSQSINSANFMFVCAVKKSRQLRNLRAVGILLDELECLYLGQSWDLYYKFNLCCPTESEYLTMVDNKTGGKNEKECIDFNRLTLLFGRFFQIRDDYMNIDSVEYSDQKGFCEDLDEGKLSYPLVHCLQDNPVLRSRILGIFRQRPTTIDQVPTALPLQTKIYILNEIKASGAMERTLNTLKKLEEELIAEIGALEARVGMENPMLRLLLSILTVT
ncbi:isoprenoid synthase domain-containing protein [Leptodontidium sp. 2 PMI_412]|nr:isoprenoid synthase domain-containing protein [Leptodontidium sp. 2 PMI_412]